jgi:hypothetical protein
MTRNEEGKRRIFRFQTTTVSRAGAGYLCFHKSWSGAANILPCSLDVIQTSTARAIWSRMSLRIQSKGGQIVTTSSVLVYFRRAALLWILRIYTIHVTPLQFDDKLIKSAWIYWEIPRKISFNLQVAKWRNYWVSNIFLVQRPEKYKEIIEYLQIW